MAGAATPRPFAALFLSFRSKSRSRACPAGRAPLRRVKPWWGIWLVVLVCAGVAWCPSSPSAPEGLSSFRGRRRSLGAVPGVLVAAADPEKVIGLRPPTGRTDTPRCVRVAVTLAIDLPVFGVV